MKDFYEAKRELVADVKREFTFAGVRFELLPVMPGDAYGDWAELGNGNYDGNVWDLLVGVVRRSLQPPFRDQWDRVLAQEREVPITLDTISALIVGIIQEEDELVEKLTGRPLESSSPSTSTPENTATRSTGDSESPAAKASRPSTSVPV